MGDQFVDAALDLAARGFAVFPCKPRGKQPATQHGLHDATTDPDRIRAWWAQTPSANVAIATGEISGIVVVDVDTDHDGESTLAALEVEHGPLPVTPRALTGGDGFHHVFAHPGVEVRNTAGKLGPGIDTRGDGGYIVAPPSLHPSGNVYEWLIAPGEVDLAPLPGWLLEQLQRRPEPPAAAARPRHTPGPGEVTPYARKVLDERLGEVRQAIAGTRNDTLNQAAFRLGQLVAGGQVPEQLVVDELTAAAAAVGLGAGETDKTIGSGLSAGKADPQYPDPRRSSTSTSTSTRSSSSPGAVEPDPPPWPDDEASGDSAPIVDRMAHDDGIRLAHRLTEVGNAQRLVEAYGHELRYVPQWGAWLVWRGDRWERDTTGAIDRRAKRIAAALFAEAITHADAATRKQWLAHAGKTETSRGVAALIRLAQSEPTIPVEPHQLDADPWLLNVANGTLDLRTGRLRPHTQADLITKRIPIAYDPTATYPDWDRFLDTATGGDHELARFLQRAVGYSLTGDTSEEKLFFVHGPTAAGKSTFMEAVKAMLGDYASQSDFETFLARNDAGGPRGDIARLAGARLVASIEVDEGKKLAEGLVKTLTGGDTVTARFLYRDEFEFRPAFKLWLVANHAPRVRHSDDAMWRRILRIPFDHPPVERDDTLKPRLRDPEHGGPAVLAWAVAGCQQWLDRGLDTPASVTTATAGYRADMDPLGEFLEDRCEFIPADPDVWVSAAALRAAYEDWCREEGQKLTLSPKAFKDTLEEHGAAPDRRRIEGKVRRIWTGIRLLPEWERDARDARDGTYEKSTHARAREEEFPETPSHPARASHPPIDPDDIPPTDPLEHLDQQEERW